MPLDQLTTKPEATLDGLAADRKLAKFRAIDDSDASITATPEQIATTLTDPLAPLLAPKLGTDYSKLEKQIVPGEFWYYPGGQLGIKHQVYTQTFIGTTPATSGTAITLDNKEYFLMAQLVCGGVFFAGDYITANSIISEWRWHYKLINNNLTAFALGSSVLSKPYIFTFKFICA